MHGLFKSANTCMQPNTVSAQPGSTDACNQTTLVACIWPGQMQPGCLELAWLGWEGYQTRPRLLVGQPRRRPIATQPHKTTRGRPTPDSTTTGHRAPKERNGAATAAAVVSSRTSDRRTRIPISPRKVAHTRPRPCSVRQQCHWRSRSCRTCGTASPTASAHGAAPRSSGSAPRTSTPATR